MPGERIPLEPGTIDTVVSTFTLCTVSDVPDVLTGLRRVLRAEGRLIFLELGLSPDPAVQRWQHRLEPLQRWLFEGLSLTRDIPSLLEQGGFEIEQVDAAYLARFPRSSSYCWWGRSRARA